MIKHILQLSCLTLLGACSLRADWLDDLAVTIGGRRQWNQTEAEAIVRRSLNVQKASNCEIQHQKDVNSKREGLAPKAHNVINSLELSSGESSAQYLTRVLSAVKELGENKRDRLQVVERLHSLYHEFQELNTLQAEYDKLQAELDRAVHATDKVALGTKIAAKATEIGAKKTKIAAKRASLKTLILSNAVDERNNYHTAAPAA